LVTIAERFFVPIEICQTARPEIDKSPYAIESMLNYGTIDVETVISQRRKEFFTEIAKKNVEREPAVSGKI
jgi:hypothetical protein